MGVFGGVDWGLLDWGLLDWESEVLTTAAGTTGERLVEGGASEEASRIPSARASEGLGVAGVVDGDVRAGARGAEALERGEGEAHRVAGSEQPIWPTAMAVKR